MSSERLIQPPEPIQPPPIIPPTPVPILASRTIWANVVVMAAIVVARRFGYELTVDEQAVIVAAMNIALRFLTQAPLALTGPTKTSEP